MMPNDPRHGTYAGGAAHRRARQHVCEPCRRAEARYEQERQLDILAGRPRIGPSLGTRRRIQALVALGHTLTRIAEALDVTPAMASAFANRPTHYTLATTAAKVAALYDAWSMTLPPAHTALQRRNAAYARTIADKKGWVVPLSWDDIDNDLEPRGERTLEVAYRLGDIDEVVVRRVLDGDRVHANTAERREIVRLWPTTGRPMAALEELTGWKLERYTAAQENAA